MEGEGGERMNVNLEALCRVYLLIDSSEFNSILDDWAESVEREQKAKVKFIDPNLSEEEAEGWAKVYRIGMEEGIISVFKILFRLITRELNKEYEEFWRNVSYICPRCGDVALKPNDCDIPVMNARYTMSFECGKCGYVYEFPQAMLVRDVFTEYANEKKEV